MDDQKDQEKKEPQHNEMTDEVILNKARDFLKKWWGRLNGQLDLLNLSKGWRIYLLVLLICNVYILLFYSRVIWIIAVLLPFLIMPMFLYGHIIIPSVMFLNIITATLFIMRYRKHKLLFYFSIVALLISLALFLVTVNSLISYIVYTLVF